MSEQPLEHSNIDEKPLGTKGPLSPSERAQFEAFQARVEKKTASPEIPDEGGSLVHGGLTHKQISAAIEGKPIDERILNLDQTEEAEKLNLVLKELQGDSQKFSTNSKTLGKDVRDVLGMN